MGSGLREEPWQATNHSTGIPSRPSSAVSRPGTRAGGAGASVELGSLDASGRSQSRDAAPATPQFTELDPHAAPEVVDVGAESEGKDAGAAGDAFGTGRSSAGDARDGPAIPPSRLVGNPGAEADDFPSAARKHHPLKQCRARLCQPWLWARRKPYLAAAAATFVFGVLALVILPIVLHSVSVDAAISNSTSSAAPLPANCSSCSLSAPSTFATPAAAAPNATQCLHNASWVLNVSYMGVAESAGKPWPYRLFSTPNAAACCSMCFTEFPAGCQGWSFLPWDNTPVPCTIIYGWNGTSSVSTACPNGGAQIAFGTDPNRLGSVGDIGPCGSNV